MLAFEYANECEFLYATGPDETIVRKRLRLHRLFWGETREYPGEQWLIEGLDVDMGEIREFALKYILVPSTERPKETGPLGPSQGNGRHQNVG